MRLSHKIKIWGIKRKIKANPFIGTREPDGTFLYSEGRFTIRYAILHTEAPHKRNIPQWLSVKIRLTSHENLLRKTERDFADFWHYQKWLFIFQPSTVAVLIVIGLFIYLGAVEFQPGKGYLMRWFASRAIGVSPEEIEYRGGGWVRVFGSRTRIDKEREQFYGDINLFRWLVFKDAGSLTRYTGDESRPITHSVSVDESGEVYFKRTGEWQKGEAGRGAVEWEKPQVVGSKEKGKIVRGQTIETTKDKIEIRDK